jgi:hypothetical protein
LNSEDEKEVLKGLTLRVYKYILRNDKPVGIREVQRSLELSSPTLALYHINKLEDAGFVKKQMNGYVADRVVLEDLVRFGRMLVPKNLFFTFFMVTSLIVSVVFLRPPVLTGEYVFPLIVIVVATIASIYDTVRAFSEKAL